MIRSQQPRNQSPLFRRPDATETQRAAILFTTIYCGLILLLTTFGSLQLYQWARNRIASSGSIIFFPPAASNVAQNSGEINSGDTAAVAPDEPAVASSQLTPINVLILGTDERPRETSNANTDSLILLTLNPATQAAGMLSFSRDLWVPVPNSNENAKLNTIYAEGDLQNPGNGEVLTMQTISRLIGQPVDYYVRINFNGFVQLVDSIGGIDVTVPKTIHDTEYPTADYGVETFHLEAGRQHLDGATALKYARTRHVDTDYGRQRRQQDVIRAVFDKVRNTDQIPTLLANLPQLLGSVETNLISDLSWSSQLGYANYLRGASLAGFQQEVIDGRFGKEAFNDLGQWVLIPDRRAVRQAVDQHFAGLSAPRLVSNGAPVAGQAVRIQVLNGSGTSKVAARTSELLRAKGWNVVSIGDADRHDYTQTLIVNNGNVAGDILTRLKADLPAQPRQNPLTSLRQDSLVDVTIVVGDDMAPLLEALIQP